ncbi:MAG: hypothetical protein ACI4MM_10430 [Candidatus Ventricola sp.]
MHEERIFLRRLLRALIAEREDSAILYIPHGEAGQRRMIDALLSLRPAREDDPLAQEIERYQGMHE